MAFGGFDDRHGPMRPMAEINTTPLVDVMLVLLVIFIITAPLLTHAVRLDLPQAAASPSTADGAPVVVSIDAGGRVYWDESPIDGEDALSARLAEAAARTPQPELHLRADRETRYQRIAEVMAAAQRAGVSRIGFVTDPTAGATARPTAPDRARQR